MPSVRTGVNSPGMDIVERRAVEICPLCQILACEETISVATQAYGIGNLKKFRESWYPT